MQGIAWLVTPSAASIGFACRLCLAMAGALYLSMWLQLDRPYWASLEVAVMMQPIAGLAVVRGFARASGTVVAGCAGLLIMALFGQSYELSAAALALWVALCAFGANLLRNNLSYGFAIAGFIAGVTVMLSHTLDQPPFEIAVARMSECILAAMVTSVVNVLLSPPAAARNYFRSRLALLQSIGTEFTRIARSNNASQASLDTDAQARDEQPSDPRPALQELVAQALALEHSRRYVRYESPGFANIERLARRLDYDLLALISATSSVHIYLANRPSGIDTSSLDELAEPARRLDETPDDPEAAKQAFDDAYERIIALARKPATHGRRRQIADWVVISCALDLVSRARSAVIKHGMLSARRDHTQERTSRRSEFGQPIDVKHAARNSLRTLTAVGIGGAVWVNFHDQLPTVILVILLSALTTIFSTLPSPVAAAQGFAKGLALATIAAFVVDFLILPQASSYAMLMLAMLPVVFVGGLAMTQQITLALPARISVVMFSLLVHVQNGQLVDFTVYIEIVMGISSAIGLTILAFRLVLPVTPRQRLREQMAGVFDELAHGHLGSRERFETRMYDRLNSLALSEVHEPRRFSARQAVLASVNIGLEARQLLVMSQRVDFPEALKQAIDQDMRELRHVFAARHPSLDAIVPIQHSSHRLAQDMIDYAVTIEEVIERRIAIRASVSAELVASALADYALAFETTERGHLRLGAIESSSGETAQTPP